MLTAKVGHEDREKAKELGADAYVTKPFSSLALATTLRGVLRQRETARA
jgi:DNA-binding response OmpR family regulator